MRLAFGPNGATRQSGTLYTDDGGVEGAFMVTPADTHPVVASTKDERALVNKLLVEPFCDRY